MPDDHARRCVQFACLFLFLFPAVTRSVGSLQHKTTKKKKNWHHFTYDCYFIRKKKNTYLSFFFFGHGKSSNETRKKKKKKTGTKNGSRSSHTRLPTNTHINARTRTRLYAELRSADAYSPENEEKKTNNKKKKRKEASRQVLFKSTKVAHEDSNFLLFAVLWAAN